ncbi:reactive intermediate/imine deaminase [Rubrivirga sp. SAORIC476]|uniref:RidA family protein n=1 Tax=Rubrivirga sp. SAORIC476 TaxID=1961794 RepID=UPI000BA94A62|nr:RidA family protein [Rubrivirga sp. SAORIC476]MAQ92576.1 RidA family protein [Rhodothermaceae bacterium]MBC15275.1 RidA family protein [Rhodothermaceae bacterium]PAP79075.1 reactive intermediate/imine deaminase [Rubrivirga sp. SAORIC476]
MTTQPPSRRERIKTPDAPAAIGPYCQGLLVGETLYVSGQIALDPRSGEMVTGDIEEETAQILDNVGAVLRAADMDFAHVAQVTLFLRDMDDYAVVNEVYARYFSGATPAREALEVGKLPREARVEISCIAVR